MTASRNRGAKAAILLFAASLAVPHEALGQDELPSSGYDLEVKQSIAPNKESFLLEIRNAENHPVICERISLQAVRAKEFSGNCGFNEETIDIVFRNVIFDPGKSFLRESEGVTPDRYYCQVSRPSYTKCERGCGGSHMLVGGSCLETKYCTANGRRYVMLTGYTQQHTNCEATHYTCNTSGEWESTFVFDKSAGQCE